MRFKLDLTFEQSHHLMNHMITKLTLLKAPPFFSSIELNGDVFIINYRRSLEIPPTTYRCGTNEYNVILEWFKPYMRDCKLDQLGI